MSFEPGSQQDIDPVDKQLADPSFNPIAFVNSLLPDEESSAKISTLLSQLNARNQKISSTVLEAVRSYSILGDRSDSILGESKNSIIELSDKINKIHSEALETEKFVSQTCGGIKPLDNSKRNLTASVTCLRRLSMISTTIASLETNSKQPQYKECTENILALTTLFEAFSKYLDTPQIKPLFSKFNSLKKSLRTQIANDLDLKISRGLIDTSTLPICTIIDAFGDDFHDSTINRFCDQFLQGYTTSFANNDLTQMKLRFNWFKQRMEFYNKNFATGFPPEWRMQYQLSKAFCKITATHLKKILSAGTPDLPPYLESFGLTVKFEEKMSTSFSQTVTVPFDPNEPMPEFGNDADGVKKKYEWLQRQKEQKSSTKIVPAKEFIGMIAPVFAPHIGLFLQAERNASTKIIEASLASIKEDVDAEQHLISSYNTVVTAMKKSIQKCVGFGVGTTLLDLFLALKELLIKYISGLTACLPAKLKSDDQIQLMCAIANTTSSFMTIVDSLAQKITELIAEEMKGGVTVDDVKESIGAQIKDQILYIVNSFVKENESTFTQIGSNQWSATDTEKLPMKLVTSFDSKFAIVGIWLSNENMNRLRPALVQRVVQLIEEGVMKTRGLSIDASSRVMCTVKELKNSLIYWTKADSVNSTKRMNSDFLALETELTIICCPEIAMAVTYLGKMKKPSKEHFMSIVKLRGLDQDAEAELSKEYDQQLALMKEAETPKGA